MKSVVTKAVKKARNLEPSERRSKSHEEIARMLEASKAKIYVVGVGGSGGNTLQRMYEIGIQGAITVGANTDAQALLNISCDEKMLIGKEITRGLGAGSMPELGEAAARESCDEINEVMGDADLIFITCGLGGGTGSGAAPVIAEYARESKALTLGVVTLPFTVEGKRRMENALESLAKLKKSADTVIVIPNDKILEVAPDLPINAAFKVVDEVLTNAVKGIAELITKPGLVNLDFADLRTILERGGPAMIGLGESTSEHTTDSRALEAVENALTSPLLDVDISNAQRALINVIGGTDMTLREAEMIVETVASKIHPNAHIIWGAMVDEELSRGQIQAMVVVAGGEFPYLDKVIESQGEKGIDLGVDFM